MSDERFLRYLHLLVGEAARLGVTLRALSREPNEERRARLDRLFWRSMTRFHRRKALVAEAEAIILSQGASAARVLH